jgi:hypothetical protein
VRRCRRYGELLVNAEARMTRDNRGSDLEAGDRMPWEHRLKRTMT